MLRSALLIFVVFLNFNDGKITLNETLRKTASPYTKSPTILDQSYRAQQLHLRKVFNDLNIHRNAKVADVGAGNGWLTIHLAKYIGPKGKVYAEDITPTFISHMTEEIKRYKLNNVELILGSPTDPKLPQNMLDTVIILNAYHEFQKPITMLTKIRQAMKTGARLGILDRDTDEMRMNARETYTKIGYIPRRINETVSDYYLTSGHYLALDIVMRETTSVGFKYLFSRELGDDYYIAVFSNS